MLDIYSLLTTSPECTQSGTCVCMAELCAFLPFPAPPNKSNTPNLPSSLRIPEGT